MTEWKPKRSRGLAAGPPVVERSRVTLHGNPHYSPGVDSAMRYDVVIVGGGPAGLAAALALGRARKRVLLCDSGSPRNARAAHVQNFVTRDGVPPREFRRIARQELGAYANVTVRDARADAISGDHGAFAVQLAGNTVEARRIILATGMIDDIPDIEGMGELWGTSVFQCPYCHGWEVQDQRFAYLATNPEAMPFALLLRGWTSDVVVLTDGKFEVPEETRTQLAQGEVRVDERPIQRLSAENGRLEYIELVDGPRLECDAVFTHPRQTQVPLVQALGLALDDKGFVRVDETTRETSIPGIYAAGDLTTSAQGAVLGAAAGMLAAARLNHALTVELATAGVLA